jgi:hypothetical protein
VISKGICVAYQVRNEDSELMRVVGRLEEAKALVAKRSGWTYKKVNTPKPVFNFEEAPF